MTNSLWGLLILQGKLAVARILKGQLPMHVDGAPEGGDQEHLGSSDHGVPQIIPKKNGDLMGFNGI